MEDTNNKSKKTERMNVRDFITIAVLLVLVYLIFIFVGTPFGFLPQTNLFVFAVCAIPWGVIYMLLLTKVNKKMVVLIIGLILAIVQLMNYWLVSVFILVGSIIAEIIWQKTNRKRFINIMTCYTIQITMWYLATPMSLLLLWENFRETIPAFAFDLYSQVYEILISGPFFILSLLATIGGCIAGAYLGKVLLKKHFEKAGIV
jgi:energy-coupling factor transport system substrate-specific component